MRQVWSSAALNSCWLLTDQERELLHGKSTEGRILFGVYLKYYQQYASFPKDLIVIPAEVWDFMAGQIDGPHEWRPGFTPTGLARMQRRYSTEIRSFLGIRRFDRTARMAFEKWSLSWLLPQAFDEPRQLLEIQAWFCEHRYELADSKALKRVLGAAERAFERHLLDSLVKRLGPHHHTALENLLNSSEGITDFGRLRSGTGKPSVESIIQIAQQLELIRSIGLPSDLINNFTPRLIARYRLRASSEDA